MKNRRFTLEEYLPGGRFLLKSFRRDRVALAKRFRQFTAVYEDDFERQLDRLDTLESRFVKSNESKDVTSQLYLATNATTKELKFLAFYVKKAKLDVKVLSGVRKDLRNGNVEGASKKLEDVVQYVTKNNVALEAKGLPEEYATVLTDQKATLSKLNELQNEFLNARIKLTEVNKAEYAAAYAFISEIAEAGKIYFEGKKEEDEYTISKLISRMRSGNSGSAGEKGGSEA